MSFYKFLDSILRPKPYYLHFLHHSRLPTFVVFHLSLASLSSVAHILLNEFPYFKFHQTLDGTDRSCHNGCTLLFIDCSQIQWNYYMSLYLESFLYWSSLSWLLLLCIFLFCGHLYTFNFIIIIGIASWMSSHLKIQKLYQSSLLCNFRLWIFN